MYPGLIHLVRQAKQGNVERIAISTNGSANIDLYNNLISAGVDDMSISLDACCAAVGEKMSGAANGAWGRVIANIKSLSSRVYVSVGMVFDEHNVSTCEESVLFAGSLGVEDIRIIPSAQYNVALSALSEMPEDFLDKYPILKYRVDNLKRGEHVRGMGGDDGGRCRLALDDMAVAGGEHGLKHFPCIIYLREGGAPIGDVGPQMRNERETWVLGHSPLDDDICKNNCLDVCVQFNRTARSAR